MSFLSREKVSHSIQALLLFADISKQSDVVRAPCVELMEKLESETITPSKGAFELNTLIEKMNHSLGAPYPLMQTDSAENFVKGEVVAFERYLNQGLKVNQLTIQDEAPLFDESLTLWEQIGTKLSAEEATSKLKSLIEKLNQLLPDDEYYP